MASIQSCVLRFLLRKTVNWNKPLDEIREFHLNVEKKELVPPNIIIEKIFENGIESEWYIPNGSDLDKTLIYFHGGGYCLGVVHANRNFVMNMAADFNTPIVLLNYRLAPENPYPAALNDAVALYEWLLNVRKLKPENIGCIGDSSGCGLCLAMLQAVKIKGLPLPLLQVFMSPVVDLKRSGKSFQTMAIKDPMQMKEDYFIDNHYIKGNDPLDPLISPIYGDLNGFPQTMIQASEYDVFLSDSEMLHQKLEKQGVKVHFEIWKKMWHNFQMSAALLPEGKKAIGEIKEFIKKQFANKATV